MKYYKEKLEIKPILTIVSSGIVASFHDVTGRKILITPTLNMLAKKGCKCDVCGVEGDHFKMIKSNKLEKKLHLFNKNGTRMTIDHHVPRCAGGKSVQDNYVPLCSTCNGIWKTKFDQIERDNIDFKEGIINLTKGDIVK